jgi:hypothetical protein
MIVSLSQPTIRQQPRSAIVARSPVRSHPSARSVSADFSGKSKLHRDPS